MPNRRRLNFNDAAPDLTLLSPAGEPVTLSRLWQEKPLLLAFTRHFGCTQCKEMLRVLVENRDQILANGLAMAIVMQGTPEETAAFAAQYAPGLYCLADPERAAYHAYGLQRGGLFNLFLHPKIWAALSRAHRRGLKVELPPKGQDARQLSGAFIISRRGRVEMPYYYDHIADHPPVDLLVKGVLSTRWDRDFDGPLGFIG